jgi:hypothetical protein
MPSGLLLRADIARPVQHVSNVPTSDIRQLMRLTELPAPLEPELLPVQDAIFAKAVRDAQLSHVIEMVEQPLAPRDLPPETARELNDLYREWQPGTTEAG